MGELYTYLPLTAENEAAELAVPPLSIANTDYGYSVGRGAFNFTAGTWFTVAERIKLNDPASYNGLCISPCVLIISSDCRRLVTGEVQIFINGEPVIDLTGVSLRNTSDSVVMGMHFQTFFGGKHIIHRR